jgi:hypothetical protein
MRHLRRSALFRWLGTSLALTLVLLTASECLADTVVARDGTKYEGRLANRSFYFDGSVPADYVGIMALDPDTAEETFVRIRTEDVDYIVLGEGADARILDPAALATRRRAHDVPARPVRLEDPKGRHPQGTPAGAVGVVLVVAGAVAAGFGIFHKFGGPKLTYVGTTSKYEAHSYDATNYALMVGGAALSLGGIVVLSNESDKQERSGLIGSDRITRVGLAFRF